MLSAVLQGGPVVVQIPTPLPPFPEPSWWFTIPPPAQVFIVLACLAAVAFITWPLVRAIARRIEGRAGADPAELARLRDEVIDLRERIHHVEEVQGRVLELEERLDFAERLLADRPPARVRGEVSP